ncbi:MAG: hypothetical protein RLZZ299_136 [Pseudomonadota bacterium]
MRIHALFLLPALAACAFEETLPEKDFRGKVILPRAAALQGVIGPDGRLNETDCADDPAACDGLVEDMRLIGPVYLGAFAAIDTESFPYPHPAMGPVVTPNYPGNTFPYGGTTVGRFEYGCFETTSCRVVTGRFADYDGILDYFSGMLGDPVLDRDGSEVLSPSVMQQACFDYHRVTSDAEVGLVGELDFKLNDAGDAYEAAFTMPHTVFVEGMRVWGWMDAPRITLDAGDVNGQFSSCDPSTGRQVNTYDQDFTQGRTHYNLLNFPSLYIYEGDWVSAGSEPVMGPDEEIIVRLDQLVTEAE